MSGLLDILVDEVKKHVEGRGADARTRLAPPSDETGKQPKKATREGQSIQHVITFNTPSFASTR